MRLTTMLLGSRQEVREAYLRDCLREFEQANRQGAYATREEYLSARREERETHRRNWAEEDANN